MLPAREDATLADGAVRIAAGHPDTAALGAMFGAVTRREGLSAMFDTLHQFGNALLGPTLWLVVWSLVKIVARGAAADDLRRLPHAVGAQGHRLHADPPRPQPRRPAAACCSRSPTR